MNTSLFWMVRFAVCIANMCFDLMLPHALAFRLRDAVNACILGLVWCLATHVVNPCTATHVISPSMAMADKILLLAAWYDLTDKPQIREDMESPSKFCCHPVVL